MGPLEKNTIRLERRGVGPAETPSVTLICALVSHHGRERGSGEPAYLIATGLPRTFDRSRPGEWTHAVSCRLPNGEADLHAVQPMGRDGARFVLR